MKQFIRLLLFSFFHKDLDWLECTDITYDSLSLTCDLSPVVYLCASAIKDDDSDDEKGTDDSIVVHGH